MVACQHLILSFHSRSRIFVTSPFSLPISPWMFNVVGYMNYRYFFLFLLWVFTACVYGLLITSMPFIAKVREDHLRGNGRVKVARGFNAESAVAYTFVLALSMSIAVGLLFFWHVYLIFTGQTTIEFYGNQTRAYKARLRGLRYRNPYDAGSPRRNWEHVFGKEHPFIAVIIPSTRLPPFPPWPVGQHHTDAIQEQHIV